MARRAYQQDPWRCFSTLERVQRLYTHADETLGITYCPSLDRAILARHVVLNEQDSENASADWLMVRLAQPDAVAHSLILSTRHHLPGTDNRLLLLDLIDFAFPEGRIYILSRQIAELRGRYPQLTPDLCRSVLLDRLDDIISNIRLGCQLTRVDRSEREWFAAIMAGLELARAELGDLQQPTQPVRCLVQAY